MINRAGEFISRHPASVPVFLAVVGALFTVNAYRIGVAHAQLRSAEAFLASERLGG